MANKKTAKKKTTKKAVKKSRARKKQDNYDKILKSFLIVAGLILFLILVIAFTANQKKSFDYNGVEFNVIEFCDAGPPCLVTYNTKLPVTYEGREVNYNFYLRNDPRKLEKQVLFNGELVLKEDMYIDITFNRFCEGYEQIAMENFRQLHNIAGIKILNGKNETCESSTKAGGMYVVIKESQDGKTSVEQTDSACYNINIKNCEIIEGTERFMIETFVKVNKWL